MSWLKNQVKPDPDDVDSVIGWFTTNVGIGVTIGTGLLLVGGIIWAAIT